MPRTNCAEKQGWNMAKQINSRRLPNSKKNCSKWYCFCAGISHTPTLIQFNFPTHHSWQVISPTRDCFQLFCPCSCMKMFTTEASKWKRYAKDIRLLTLLIILYINDYRQADHLESIRLCANDWRRFAVLLYSLSSNKVPWVHWNQKPENHVKKRVFHKFQRYQD